MDRDTMLAGVVKTLGSVRDGGAKGAPALTDLDGGVLTVALMVAGLDGAILPAEYAACVSLAEVYCGAVATNVRTCFDVASARAGRLVVMAQVDAYDVSERLAAFVQMAETSLPRHFSAGSIVDLRCAFVLWLAMAVADGTFTDLERQALAVLGERFTTVRTTKHAVSILEPDFFAKAEELVRQLSASTELRRAEAELIAFVCRGR